MSLISSKIENPKLQINCDKAIENPTQKNTNRLTYNISNVSRNSSNISASYIGQNNNSSQNQDQDQNTNAYHKIQKSLSNFEINGFDYLKAARPKNLALKNQSQNLIQQRYKNNLQYIPPPKQSSIDHCRVGVPANSRVTNRNSRTGQGSPINRFQPLTLMKL